MPSQFVHVAVGVVTDASGRILIAQRSEDAHQGGLWEFPGGKLEKSEGVYQALQREFNEETGIAIKQAHPLIRIHYRYPDKSVLLDTWKITGFQGEAYGREGQPLKWVAANALNKYSFPAANYPIIKAAQLPHEYMITGEYGSLKEAKDHIRSRLEQGIRLVQFRANYLSTSDYNEWAAELQSLGREYSACLMLNCSPEQFSQLGADGLHLNSRRLLVCQQRPVAGHYWLAASVHNETELQHAMQIDVDFIVLSPLFKTLSHPNAVPLGWQKFQQLTEMARCPVYALGGLGTENMQDAFLHGAQGIAAIRGLA